MGTKWTEARRAKFSATMAAKSAAANTVKRTRRPREQPDVIYQMGRGGRLIRFRLRSIKAYVADTD